MSKPIKPRPTAAVVSRRDLLVGVGAVAWLAACDKVPAATAESADAAAADVDAGQAVPDVAADAAVDAAHDATASADAAADADAADVADAATGSQYIPAITPNDRYYITSCCSTPSVDAASWQMTITDRGNLVTTLDMAFLESLNPRDKEHTLECIGGGPSGPPQLISNAIWTGLPVLEIFAAKGVQVPSGITEMKFTALDGYSTGLPTSDLALPMWLVWRMNGDPLPPEHGFPARMLVPNHYGMKNPKWLKDLEFVEQPYIGFWESQGWSETAFYRPNVYIRGPVPASTFSPGLTPVFGTAFAGSDGITKVDVRVDGGEWQPAVLDYFGKPDVWTLWHFDWQATSGTHTVQARCTTASGAMSDENPEGTDPLSGYNGSMAISVTVT